MFKPETASFLKRLALTFVLVGTLVILLLVALSAAVDTLKNAHNDARDNNQLPDSIANLPANMPIGEKITFANNELSKPQSDGRRASTKRYVSALYEQNGDNYLGRADLASAELNFRNGTEIDPTNPALWSDLAFALQKEVDTQQDAERRGALLKESGDDWSRAFGLEQHLDKRANDGRGAASAYLAYAQTVLDSGDRSRYAEARQRLYNAKELVHDDAALSSQIADALQKLS